MAWNPQITAFQVFRGAEPGWRARIHLSGRVAEPYYEELIVTLYAPVTNANLTPRRIERVMTDRVKQVVTEIANEL